MIGRGGTRAVVALALAGVVAVAVRAHARGESKRYDGALFSFAYPADASAESGTDPSADVAVVVRRDDVSATVIASAKRVGEGELDDLADKWHNARIRNRAAWGVKPSGGPPRDTVRVGDRHWMRWRDRIGSVLGAQEQTMTCGAVSAHLVCVIVYAPQKERERGDVLASQILSSLSIRKR